MKRKVLTIVGLIAVIAIMAINVQILTDVHQITDVSLKSIINQAWAQDSEQDWSGLRNWLTADRKQQEKERDCVFYKKISKTFKAGTQFEYTVTKEEPTLVEKNNIVMQKDRVVLPWSVTE